MPQVSEQYREEVTKKVKSEINEYMQAKDIIGNLFRGESIGDDVVKRIILRHFDKLNEANLSSRVWDPATTKLAAATYAQWVYSAGLESEMAYEDWSLLDKANIISVGLNRIGEMPMKQLSHYFFTGAQLLNNGSRGPPPNPNQYNYAVDAGTGDGTLERPLEINVTGTAWDSAANVRSNVEEALNEYLKINPDARVEALEVFVPSTGRALFYKRYSTSGDGFVSAESVFMEHGVPRENIHVLADIYLPTGDAFGSFAAPTTSDFDVLIIDSDQVKMWWTVNKITNVYFKDMGSLYPKMVIETNAVGLPVFYPIVGENTGDKVYKGVTKIDGISAS